MLNFASIGLGKLRPLSKMSALFFDGPRPSPTLEGWNNKLLRTSLPSNAIVLLTVHLAGGGMARHLGTLGREAEQHAEEWSKSQMGQDCATAEETNQESKLYQKYKEVMNIRSEALVLRT